MSEQQSIIHITPSASPDGPDAKVTTTPSEQQLLPSMQVMISGAPNEAHLDQSKPAEKLNGPSTEVHPSTQYSAAVYTVCFKAIEVIDKKVHYSAGAHRAFKDEKLAIEAAEQLWAKMGAPVYGDDVKHDQSDQAIDSTLCRITGGISSRHKSEQLVLWVESLMVETSANGQSQPGFGHEGVRGGATPGVALETQNLGQNSQIGHE